MSDDHRHEPTNGPAAGPGAPARPAAPLEEPWASIMKHVIKPTDDPSTWIFPRRAVPPPEMAGKWVAYAADMQRIVAWGDTFEEVTSKTGDQVVSYLFVPPR